MQKEESKRCICLKFALTVNSGYSTMTNKLLGLSTSCLFSCLNLL